MMLILQIALGIVLAILIWSLLPYLLILALGLAGVALVLALVAALYFLLSNYVSIAVGGAVVVAALVILAGFMLKDIGFTWEHRRRIYSSCKNRVLNMFRWGQVAESERRKGLGYDKNDQSS